MSQIIENMPEAEYHARPEVSKHDLDLINKAPALYRFRKDNPEPPDEEMNFGSLVHMAILQPHLLESSVCYVPADAPNKPSIRQINAKKPSSETLDAIAFWKSWREENAGKQEVTEVMMEKVRGIQKSLLSTPSTARYLTGDYPKEVSLFWERAGVPCRARLDILRPVEIIDPKTCGDASRQGFMKDIGKRRYAHQAEHYTDGAKANGYKIAQVVFLAVETTKPFLCASHPIGEQSLAIARDENLRDLATYKRCVESGQWPGIKEDFRPLEAPIWAFA